MTALLVFLLLVSLAANIILVWYTRKLVKNLDYGVRNVDEFQNMLNDYSQSLNEMSKLDQYYGDETITSAVKNTNLVIEACKFYKKSILELADEVDIGEEQNG